MRFLTQAALIVTALLFAGAAMAQNEGRIYGKIYTVDDDILEGLIRWDKNEASWVDILNGTKEIPREYRREARRLGGDDQRSDRGRSIEFFGITIGSDGDVGWSGTASSGIRFGHLKELEVIGDNRALLILKDGEEVEFRGSSTDLGSSIREIVIEDKDRGEMELVWDDIERIVFEPTDYDKPSNFGERLYGTLTTRRGEQFTGYVCWDIDELFTNDILDGEERDRDRRIKFEKIQRIERYSSSAARVFETNGEDIILRGTNDVNDENRGIVINDPDLGEVTVEWADFDRLEFSRPERVITYDDFDGARRLSGTVYTEDGESHTGKIRWDNDEEYTWEMLNGEYRDVAYSVEFISVKKIEKRGGASCVVTLRDGRELHLRGSNDVTDDNKGIFITGDDDETVLVSWDDFEMVEFAAK